VPEGALALGRARQVNKPGLARRLMDGCAHQEGTERARPMCGIVGVLGSRGRAPILVEALKRLEYRGYDSAGIATVNDGVLDRRRAVGKLTTSPTCWCTSRCRASPGSAIPAGPPMAARRSSNAHPHRAGRVAVVHNGIIENYRARRNCSAEGPGLRKRHRHRNRRASVRVLPRTRAVPREAPPQTLEAPGGRLRAGFLFDGEEDLIVAARKGSPLAIGHGDGEMFVGSDAIALAPLTDRITYLEEGDYAFVTRAGVEIRDAEGRQVPSRHGPDRRPGRAGRQGRAQALHGQGDLRAAHRAGAMPVALHRATGMCCPRRRSISPSTDRLIMVACGTAHYACLVAKYWFEQLAGLPCDVDIASEFRYREPPVSDQATALFVSQSGETADTLAALRYARGKAKAVVSLVNVPESSIARESDAALPILAGVEIGVASTKAFMNQLARWPASRDRRRPPARAPDARAGGGACQTLRSLPALINQALALEDRSAPRPETGRGALGPVPRPWPDVPDGAGRRAEAQGNQLYPRRSLCQRRAEARAHRAGGQQPARDRSGPARRAVRQDGVEHAGGHGPRRQGLAGQRCGRRGTAGDGVWATLTLPTVDPIFAPMLYAVPAQLIAYHTALHKGTDVDQPRNLAKSVTVE
jgi:glucosamine--fructose-6-phosphate aminotransferase (isomerizing)